MRPALISETDSHTTQIASDESLPARENSSRLLPYNYSTNHTHQHVTKIQLNYLLLHNLTAQMARNAISSLFMVALWNRAGHYIFIRWFLLSFLFPRLISAVADWMSAKLPHMVRISDAGLKRAACGSLKYRIQKLAKKSPSGHHRTTLSGYIFTIKAHIDNRKKTC